MRLLACATSSALCWRNALLRCAFTYVLSGYLPVSSLGVYQGVPTTSPCCPFGMTLCVLLPVLRLGPTTIGVGRPRFRPLPCWRSVGAWVEVVLGARSTCIPCHIRILAQRCIGQLGRCVPAGEKRRRYITAFESRVDPCLSPLSHPVTTTSRYPSCACVKGGGEE